MAEAAAINSFRSNIKQPRFSTTKAVGFAGGDIDPLTGNVRKPTAGQVSGVNNDPATGKAPDAGDSTATGAEALSTFTAEPEGSSTGKLAGVGLGTALAGPLLGEAAKQGFKSLIGPSAGVDAAKAAAGTELTGAMDPRLGELGMNPEADVGPWPAADAAPIAEVPDVGPWPAAQAPMSGADLSGAVPGSAQVSAPITTDSVGTQFGNAADEGFGTLAQDVPDVGPWPAADASLGGADYTGGGVDLSGAVGDAGFQGAGADAIYGGAEAAGAAGAEAAGGALAGSWAGPIALAVANTENIMNAGGDIADFLFNGAGGDSSASDRAFQEANPEWWAQMQAQKAITDPIAEQQGGGCFITEAVMSVGGQDGGMELEALRGFRENILAASPQGQALIQEYEAIAPVVVEAVSQRQDGVQVFQQIKGQFIDPAVAAVQAGDFEEALRLYAEMIAFVTPFAAEAAAGPDGSGDTSELDDFGDHAALVGHSPEALSNIMPDQEWDPMDGMGGSGPGMPPGGQPGINQMFAQQQTRRY